MDGPILITFGVELEFYIGFRPSDYEKAVEEFDRHHPEYSFLRYRSLLQFTVQARMIGILKEHHFAVNDIGVTETNYSKWTVAGDPSIQPALDNPEYGNPELCFESIELKSPALPYSPQSVELISRAISIINQAFSPAVNSSTGFHVHVGNKAHEFSLQTLKNFASLVTVFQRQIQSVHAKERLDNEFCPPPSTKFRQQPPLEIAKVLHSVSDMGELLGIIADGDRYQAYNFENLRERLKTIEFRQHKGTMESEEITNYVHLVCGLVCASHLAGPAGFTDLIVRNATYPDSEHYSFLDLLADLQLHRLIPYYSTRIRNHRRLSHEWHPDLSSPEVDSVGEEDEELQNDPRPAWKGSPEFEMRSTPDLSSPEGDSEDEEDEEDEELQDDPHPAWKGSPEFEMRPTRPLTDPENDPHGETRDPQHFPQTAWDSRESDAPPGQYWNAEHDDDPATDIQEGLQDLEDNSQESEPAPRGLRIANPDNDPDSDSEEDLEEPAEWRDFDWDWREHALEGRTPDSPPPYSSEWES